jgi:hypothetical protein
MTPMHPVGPVSVVVGNDQGLSTLDGRFAFACPAVPDRTLVLLIVLAGALGGLVHALRSFFWYAGEQKLLWNWVPMYLVLPYSSAALAFVFFLVVRAGLYQPTPGTSYLLVGLAALVGMFSAQATEKLKAVAEGLFNKAPQGKDPAPPADSAKLAPTISSLTPTSGPKNGGNTVTISGTGFTTQSVVRFDQATAKATFVNATTLRAVAPKSGTVAVVDVAVRAGDKETTKEKVYSYVEPKGTITTIDPSDGKPVGGTTVRIVGTSLGAHAAVSFGDKQAKPVKVVDATTLEVTAPAQAAGKVDVRVDDGADLVAVAPDGFEYKP